MKNLSIHTSKKLISLSAWLFLINIFSTNGQPQTLSTFKLNGKVMSVEIIDSSIVKKNGESDYEVETSSIYFDSIGNLTKRVYNNSLAHSYIYLEDSANKIVIDYNLLKGDTNSITTVIYNSFNDEVKSIQVQKNGEKRVFNYSYTYDSKNRKTKRISTEEGDPRTYIVRYFYDAATNIITQKNYDGEGKLNSMEKIDKEGNSLEYFTYENDGTISSKRLSTYGKTNGYKKWNSKGILKESSTYTYQFDKHGNVIQTTGKNINYQDKVIKNVIVDWKEIQRIVYY